MRTNINLVEFFAGSAEISEEAKKRGVNTFTIDWKQYGKIDFVQDIELVEVDDIPFVPDVGWFSPDCTTYSIAAISTHRYKETFLPKSDYAKKCDRVNKHFIRLINQWLEINPNFVFFIENPRGGVEKDVLYARV
jgi:site-specific DNA-cytosine methylase